MTDLTHATFRVVPSATPTGHRFGVSWSDIFAPPAPRTKARALLTLSLEAIDPRLQGVSIPFLEVPAAFSVVDLNLQASGLYQLRRVGDFSHGGKTFSRHFKTLPRFAEALEDELEDTLEDCKNELHSSSRLTLGQSVDLKPSPDSNARKTLCWSIGPEPEWLQARRAVDYGVATRAWVYCGSVTSNYYFGVVHAYFKAREGLVRNIFECT